MNEIIIVDKPDVIFKDVNSRKDGVSGFIRCKNEDEFIDQVIHSWLENSDDLGAGFLDELVVVYNDCIDKTEEVLKQLLKIYPNKLKIYHYIPKVFAQGTKEYKELGADDYQSLVNYYNFALSKTTYKWAVKIDGDIILDPIKTADIKKYMLKMKPNEYLKLSGINIIMQRSEIYCLSGSVFCGLFSDLCLFKVHKDTFYKKDKYCEVMNFPSEYTKFKDKKLFINNTLTAYYHMKFQKNDFGFGVYDFKNNHNSNYYPKTWIFILTSHLVPLSKILKQYKLNMTNPKDFIIFKNNYDDYKTSFIDALKQSNKKDCSISVWIDEAGLFVINKIYKWGGGASDMQNPKEFKIQNRLVGINHEPLIICEIGINHEGSIKTAFEMVDAAHRAGAEVIKHQTHIVEDEMSNEAKGVIPGNADVSIYEIMKRCALSEEDEIKLQKYVESKGMIFISTPFSRAAAHRLQKMNIPAYKIGSGECNNYPLVKLIASFGKPIILSTGMNDIQSIKKTVSIIESAGVPYALLHCTNVYPTKYSDVRLGAMSELMREFPNAVVGLSDHTTDNYACMGAVALGASILERHFTDSMHRVGPDIVCSMDPIAFKELKTASSALAKMRFGQKNTLIDDEKPTKAFAFASVVADADIKKGDVLSGENLWVKRPSGGDFGADEYESLFGKIAKNDIAKNSQIKKQDIY